MSVSSIQSGIERIQRDIEALHRQQTDEMRKEASKTERIAQVGQSITRTTTASTLQSKQKDGGWLTPFACRIVLGRCGTALRCPAPFRSCLTTIQWMRVSSNAGNASRRVRRSSARWS